jgi:hypothetical protein
LLIDQATLRIVAASQLQRKNPRAQRLPAYDFEIKWKQQLREKPSGNGSRGAPRR